MARVTWRTQRSQRRLYCAGRPSRARQPGFLNRRPSFPPFTPTPGNHGWTPRGRRRALRRAGGEGHD
eukprot:5160981-Pyramimonas_sp.AAC.1